MNSYGSQRTTFQGKTAPGLSMSRHGTHWQIWFAAIAVVIPLLLLFQTLPATAVNGSEPSQAEPVRYQGLLKNIAKNTYLEISFWGDKKVWVDTGHRGTQVTYPAPGQTAALVMGGTCVRSEQAATPYFTTIPAGDESSCMKFKAAPTASGNFTFQVNDARSPANGNYLGDGDNGGVLDLLPTAPLMEFEVSQPDAAKSAFSVTTGNRVADGVEAHTVTASLADKDGNPVLTANLSKLAGVSDPAAGVTIGDWVSNGDGTYTATVVSTVAGSKAVTVSFDGAAIRADKNTDAVFVAGAVDPSNVNTKYTVTEGAKIADGVEAHTVTASLADKDGNPVPDADLSKLAGVSDPAAGVTIGDWVSNGDGTYTATVVSTVAGSKAVTVSFDGAA
ncbi:hypothetical protein ODZ83_10930, partial [Acaricomes phytoseiuli]|uniref:invasin domain 3-containing protein n=1 Tax=Acaricomes phytoseiuli TaxID=291968 RepID=UPI0029CA8384